MTIVERTLAADGRPRKARSRTRPRRPPIADNPPDDRSGREPKPDNLGAPWSVAEERRLYDAFAAPADVLALASRHGRTRGGIRSRLAVLGLLDEAGQPISPKPPFTPSASVLRRTMRPPRRGRERGSGPVSSESTDALVLAMLAQLGPARRATALEVIRGLVVLEAAEASAVWAGTAASDETCAGKPAVHAVEAAAPS